MREVPADISLLSNIQIPPFKSILSVCDPVDAAGLYEWLSLVSLESPRITADDAIDPYLSRYEVPDFEAAATETEGTIMIKRLVKLRWHGLITPNFITSLWLLVQKAVGEEWAALNVACFRGNSYSLLGVSARESLTWEST